MEIGLSVSPTRPWRTGGPFSGHATLTSGLVSYWKLDEVSGNRADSHGSNTLTDNNTVTSATGMRNLAAEFTEGNSESLNRATALQSAPKTYALWYKSAGNLIVHNLLQDKGTVVELYHGTDNLLRVRLLVWNGSSYSTATTGFVAKVLGWLHIVVDVTDGGNANLYVNDGEFSASVAVGGSEVTVPLFFQISASPFSTYLVDETAVWSRVLTAQERTDLYNAGAGLFY